MGVTDAFIYRVIGPVSPSAKARLRWRRERRAGGSHSVVDAVVRAGDIVVDIGANGGLFTDRFARLVGPRGHVHAFEPYPGYKTPLLRIAAARRNVTYHPVAVSDSRGLALLHVPVHASRVTPAMASLEARDLTTRQEKVEVTTTTLDDALGAVAGVQFIKCDVEGHEHEVFLGAMELLARERPIVLVELEQRHRRRPLGDTIRLLEDLGYEGHALTQDGAIPVGHFDVQRDQLDLIAQDAATHDPAREYLNDFVFAPAGFLMQSAWAPGCAP